MFTNPSYLHLYAAARIAEHDVRRPLHTVSTGPLLRLPRLPFGRLLVNRHKLVEVTEPR